MQEEAQSWMTALPEDELALGSIALIWAGALHEVKSRLEHINDALCMAKMEISGGLRGGKHATQRTLETLRQGRQSVDSLRTLLLGASDMLSRRPGRPIDTEGVISVAQRVAKFFQVAGERVSVRTQDISQTSAPLTIDAKRLQYVMFAVVANAAEAGARRPIEIRLVQAADAMQISVLNVASTYPLFAGDAARATNPFFTTKTERAGLGLYLSSRFVREAGGTLDLHPTNEEGLTWLEISLPVRVNED